MIESTAITEPSHEILVRLYRGGDLVEQRSSSRPDVVADVIGLRQPQAERRELLVIEPHPPRLVAHVLRAIADAIDDEPVLATSRPLPDIRLQLRTEQAGESREASRDLRLLQQDLAHPGD